MHVSFSFPNTDIHLSQSVTQAFYRRSHALNYGVMDWSELRAWLNSQTWMRMVKHVEQPEADTLELCGFYRMVKHHRTHAVTFERKTLQITDDMMSVWSWRRTSYIPGFALQYCGGQISHHFQLILDTVLDALLKDLVKQGITQVYAPNRQSAIKTIPNQRFDKRERSEHLIPIDQPWGRELLTKRLTNQFAILGDDSRRAGKSLAKYLWAFVDKPVLSLYLKIHQCSLSATSFKAVHALANQKLDVQRFQTQALWLPWLSRVHRKHYHHPELFSYSYLLTCVRGDVTKNMVRKINQQQRQVQHWLIEHLHHAPQLLPVLGMLRAYPSSIVLKLLNIIARVPLDPCYDDRRPIPSNKLIVHIVQRWAHYFLPMAGQVKVRKQKDQWRRALNQFQDIWDWMLNEEVALHKNQTWYSLTQQHERWIAKLNVENQAKAEALDATTWTSCQNAYMLPKVSIEEITAGQRLRQEGREMEHCVFSYLEDCAKGRYRVFSLKREKERATLGLSQDPITLQCQYDQLRGAQNELSSREMEQATRQLIQQINTKIITFQS